MEETVRATVKARITAKAVIACLWALAICLGGTVGTARAQSGPTGTLSGVVKDPTGAVMMGVQVTVTNIGTSATRSATTDGDGRWIVTALPVGSYQLTFVQSGFKTLVRDSVPVEASVPRVLDAVLQVESAPGQSITVTDTVQLVTPTTPTTSRQISSNELIEVPTSTRSFTHLLSAEGGVSSDLPPALTNGNGNISPSVNGTRTTSTSLSFNGIDATNLTSNEGSLNNNISPAPETLQEVKLQTSLYDASTGRSGGGNFQLVTKSGTNDIHGSVYWYGQNDALNANEFFFKKDGIARPEATRNETGFAIGGPIIRDRLFFFGGYQYTRAKTGFVPTASSITVLPRALGLINGPRTKQSIFDAFVADNPGIVTPTFANANAVGDVALALLTLRNPATGDYFIPAPGPNAQAVRNTSGALVRDANVGSGGTLSQGGNSYMRQRNVFPAEFTEHQFTTKLDARLTDMNTLSGIFFFSDFPGLDPFPDPLSLASPVTLKRQDRNRTLVISDIHTWTNFTNELRFGYFSLNNTRVLDDPFLSITNASVGIPNPALAFDSGPGTQRLGHYVGRPGTVLERFSFGGPNDTFNRREQKSFSIGDQMSYLVGRHFLRFGGDLKRNRFNTALPEEQATEFEKYDNFTQFLRGVATEADTQFGITEKRFRFHDVSLFLADDIKVHPKLTLNLGVRWEWFGWPIELDGRIGNFDPSLVTNFNNPLSGFLVPSNATNTGFTAVDAAIAATTKTGTKHTLNGQDLNNFAPRVGFAYSPLESQRLVIRGGYGIFYDRPSVSFMNTIFSNYPFLREVEVTAPTAQVPLTTAWSQQDPNFPFNQYLPNRIVRSNNNGATGVYQLRDGTSVTRGADGTLNAIDPATGQPFVGNIAETFEFRAVDRNLRTPYIQQWNLGGQYEITKNLLVEARYVGTKGSKLLMATSFAQGYDLNDLNTPDFIFERFNSAYVAAGNANGALNAGSTARARGLGRAFGFPNSALGGMTDYNLANTGGSVISFEARSPYLGFDVPEAIFLANGASSTYHSAQFGLNKRFSSGLQFNLAYTFSKSLDNFSADPGSTAGGGKPDLPNVGFTAQGNAFDTRFNRAPSDFDRTHRVSASYVYHLPTFGSQSRFLKGWQIAGFIQAQSGVPYSIFSPEVTVGTGNAANYNSLRLGSGGLYRLAFGRPSLCGTMDQLRQQGSDITESYFNAGALCSPLSTAGGYPNNRGFGSLGRNALRGPTQRRFDIAISKHTGITESTSVEFRWEIFNAFNNVNFGLPNNVISDAGAGTDFGKITDTVGGPRVMQFGVKFGF